MEKDIKLDATQFAVASLSLLNGARQRKSHCDFIIQVGDLVIPVHKNILAIRSAYFEVMFRIEAQERKSGRVIMKGVEQDCVVKCIDYLYTGKASVLIEKIGKFLHVAHLMQIHELCDGIVALLKDGLNSKSFFETKKLADTYDLKDLGKTCDDFARINFEAVSKEETFEELEKDYVELLLESPNTVGAETIKFDAILKWIHSKPDERNELFPEMLEYINLAKLPPRYYKHLLQKEPLVYESANILRNFTLSMMKTEAIRGDALVLYDPASRSFQAKRSSASPAISSCTKLMDAPNKMGRASFTVVYWQSILYVITSAGALYSIECDDIGAEWNTLESMKQPQSHPLAVVWAGIIYVIGSSKGEQYCIGEKKWSAMPLRPAVTYSPIYFRSNNNMPVPPATDSGIVAVEGMIYVIGGKISENVGQPNYYGGNQHQRIHGVTNVQRYDTRSSKWENFGGMTNPRYSMGVTAKGQNLYAIGGSFNSQTPETRFVECLNIGINGNCWTNMTYLPVAVSIVSACVAGGKLYAVGSCRNGTVVHEFNTETNQWVTLNFDGKQQWSSRVALCVKSLM